MELVHQKDSKKTAPTINTKHAASSIKWLYTNADTLTNKMPELKALIEERKPLIIAITEVIPKKFRFPVQKAEVKVSNEYEVFLECISNKGRGITIQVHTSLNAQEVKLTTKFEESVWCEVKLSKYKKLLIGCIYRSESGSSDNNSKLNQLLQGACNKGYSCILILGDFNYKGITWENWNTPGLNDSSEEFLFVEALRDNYQQGFDKNRSPQYLIW